MSGGVVTVELVVVCTWVIVVVGLGDVAKEIEGAGILRDIRWGMG